MKRLRGNITAWTLAGILVCAPFAGGCEPLNWIGPNLSLDLIVPLGLGGTPGLLNPFGIVQAMVNELLGLNSSGTTNSNAYANPTTAAGSASQPYNPAIVAALPPTSGSTGVPPP